MEIWIILGFMIGFILMVPSPRAIASGAAVIIAVIIIIKGGWAGLAPIAGMIFGSFILDDLLQRRLIVARALIIFAAVLAIIAITRIAGCRIFY